MEVVCAVVPKSVTACENADKLNT